jgi:hypothetical protein
VSRKDAVLHDSQRDLVLDLFDGKARGGFVFDDETLDLIVIDIACPDNRQVAPGRISNPPLLAVQNPRIPFTPRRRQQSAPGAGPYQRFGQSEATDFFQPCHRRQPFLFLLFRTAKIDRAHRQSAVDAIKSCDGRVDARQLHGDKSIEKRTAARAAISFESDAYDAEVPDAGNEFERERILGPKFVDHRRDLALHEGPYPLKQSPLGIVQNLVKQIEVAIGSGKRVVRL